jgi:hypothetical protein
MMLPLVVDASVNTALFPPEPMNLSLLPREIILYIFHFLPAEDLCNNAACVSRLFNELVLDPFLWKHFCESEFKVQTQIIGNSLNITWKKEYFVMKKEWKYLVDSTLRVSDVYKDHTSLNNENEAGPTFENIREGADNERPPPITAQGLLPVFPLPIGDFTVGYFEMKLNDPGQEQILGLGLARNNYIDAMPGWRKGSVGFHADDGKVFIGCGFGRPLTTPWMVGDVVGCGIDFARMHVFFTRNGTLLGKYPIRQIQGLYPTIGSRTMGEKVTVNFGRQPFVFDIVQYQLEEREIDVYPIRYPSLYSTLVKRRLRPDAPNSMNDDEDDLEDEDNEYDDKDMNKVAQYFNSVLRVLLSTEDYKNDDGSLLSLVQLLRQQLNGNGMVLAQDMDMAELRQQLAHRVQFNKQSALLAYFMRAHEESKYKNVIRTDDDVLPRDDFPKAELVRCIAVLLSDEFRDDNPLVLNTLYRGRELFNFQPPPDMTIAQERGQLALALSREIQAHERERRHQRREIVRRMRLLSQHHLLVPQHPHDDQDGDENNNENYEENARADNDNNMDIETTSTPTSSDNDAVIDDNNNSNGNTENGNEGRYDNVPLPIIQEPLYDDDNVDGNNNNNNEEAQETQQHPDMLDADDFQEILRTFIALLSDENIPDNDPRVTAAIVQWYSTLEIDMKPEMEVSTERKRLATMLIHLGERIKDQISDKDNNTVLKRFFGKVYDTVFGRMGKVVVVALMISTLVAFRSWLNRVRK